MTVPVEVGQSRKGALGVVWGVLHPHARRRGFWICTTQDFAYDLATIGRRELEAMPLVPDTYWGQGGHPGISYWRSLEATSASVRRHRP